MAAGSWQWWGRLFVIGTTGLIIFVAVSTQYFIFIPWLSFYDDRNIYLWLAPFNLGVASILVNYFLGCRTDPGEVPSEYGRARDGEGRVPAAKRKSKKRLRGTSLEVTTPRRWCKKCKVYKPPRSHHCSMCNRCVLKMDHHCPWLNNCVGHRNLPHFIRFLVSVTLSVMCCLTLLGLRMWDLIKYQNQLAAYMENPYARISRHFYTPPLQGPEIVFMILNLLILFVLLFTVGILCAYQLWYACQNVTTIESFEVDKIAALVRRGKLSADEGSHYPYDLGTFRNLQEVLGSRWWLWWLPQQAPGDGLTFPCNEVTRKKLKRGKHVLWPPKGYYTYQKHPHGQPSTAVSENRIRRGSDGFVVREWTHEERDRMVRIAMNAGKVGSGSTEGMPRRKPLVDISDLALPPPPTPSDPSESDSAGSESEWSFYSESGGSSSGSDSSDDEPLTAGLRHRRVEEDVLR
ncbi:DHHC palmitoyltransferase-domain-containing protein [Gaertneriomyces semiglobifer]|nr:DHHC palmitoyltransferase-domain-containing protein [Gaertneriomyces semiglobifer]